MPLKTLKKTKDYLHYNYIRKTNYLKWIVRTMDKGKKDFVVRNIQGNLMHLSTKDRGISYDLIIDGIREFNSTKFVKKIIKNDDVIFDIGANIGYYVLIESSLIGNKGKIFAIEPEPNNFKNLKKNVQLNKRKNIEFFNVAVADKEGFMDLNISSYSNMHTLYHNKKSKEFVHNKIIGKKKVKVTTLDSICKKYGVRPNFVRMDVQGGEFNIIKGMKNVLKQKNPLKIFIELHPQMMKKSHTLYLLKTLEKNGFDIIKMFRDYNLAKMKFKKDIEWHYDINQLINDDDVISGKKGTFEIFFSNKIRK